MYKFFLICNNKNIQKNQTKQGGNQMKATNGYCFDAEYSV